MAWTYSYIGRRATPTNSRRRWANWRAIDNRGVKVWPGGNAWTFCTDSFRCRYMSEGDATPGQINRLLERVVGAGIEIAATQMLRNFDGKAGYTLAQGQ